MTATGRFNMASINASEFEIQNKKTITAKVDSDVKAGDKVVLDILPIEDTILEGIVRGVINSTYMSPDENLLLICHSGAPSIILYAKNPMTNKFEKQSTIAGPGTIGSKFWLTISPDWKYIIAGNGTSMGGYYPTIALLKINDLGGSKYSLSETDTSIMFGENNEINNYYMGQFYDNRTAIIPTSSGIKIFRINEDETVTLVQTIGSLSTLRQLKLIRNNTIALATCTTTTTPLLGWDISYNSGTDTFTFNAKTIPYEVTTHAGWLMDINSEEDRVGMASSTRVQYSRHVFFWEIDEDGDLNVIPYPGASWNTQYELSGNPVFSKTNPYLCLINGNVGGIKSFIIDTTSTANWTFVSPAGTMGGSQLSITGNTAMSDGSFLWLSSSSLPNTVWYDVSDSTWKYGNLLRGLQEHNNYSINVERTYAASCLNVTSLRLYKKDSNGYYNLFHEHVGTGTPSGSAYCLAWLDEYNLLVNYYSSVASERLKLLTINQVDDSITVSYADVSFGTWNYSTGLIKGENDWYFTMANWSSATSHIYKINITSKTITKLANPESMPDVGATSVRSVGTSLYMTSTSTATTNVCTKYNLDESGETPVFVRDLTVPVKATTEEVWYNWHLLNSTTSVIESNMTNYLIVFKLIEGNWVRQTDNVWSIAYQSTAGGSVVDGNYCGAQPGPQHNGYNQLTINDEGKVRETFYSYGGSRIAAGTNMPNPYPDKIWANYGYHSIVDTSRKLAYKIVAAAQNDLVDRWCVGYVKYDASAGENAVILMELATS